MAVVVLPLGKRRKKRRERVNGKQETHEEMGAHYIKFGAGKGRLWVFSQLSNHMCNDVRWILMMIINIPPPSVCVYA